jgi:hypothetical protein
MRLPDEGGLFCLSDYLRQMQWDAALLNAWHADGHMSVLMRTFMDKQGLSLEQFQQIARTPQWKQCHMPARAFVASSLPALSDRLWAGVPDVDLLDVMEGLRTAAPGRSKVTKALLAEDKEQARTKRVDIHKGHRRRDWHVCK